MEVWEEASCVFECFSARPPTPTPPHPPTPCRYVTRDREAWFSSVDSHASLLAALWADEKTEALGYQVACLQPCCFSQWDSSWSSSLAAALVQFQCHKLSCGFSSTLLTIPGTQLPHLWNGLASVSTCLYLVVIQYEWDDCKMRGTQERLNKG